jgi:putative membrane protein
MPAFTGLFAVPWCLINLLSRTRIPAQRTGRILDCSPELILRGTLAGGLGGGFAALVPGVTGGTGSMLAGQATAQRDERVFILSQGAARMVYYAGALLLFFAPGLNLTRGGGAWLLRGLYLPAGQVDYLLVTGTVALSAALAFLLLEPVARAVVRLLSRMDARIPSAVALLILVGLVLVLTGLPGLLVLLPATGIGLLPVLFGSRRLNCLGILLLPLACNMSGFGPQIAAALGLL